MVNTKQMLEQARAKKYAIAQPNAWDVASLRGIIRACEEHNSPIIIGLGEPHFKYMQVDEIFSLLRLYAEETEIPIALHLDHGATYEAQIAAIRAGFTSVMLDASTDPFDENVRRTREVVKVAHQCGVTVEAELGHVGMGSDYDSDSAIYTDPGQAAKFVALTEVDSLAVAVGTAHGEYKGEPKLNFEILAEIAQSVPVPLVLHGGSGTGEASLQRTIQMGISKINLCTDLMKAASKEVKQVIDSQPYAELGLVAEQAIYNCLSNYLQMFGSVNRAGDVNIKRKFRRQ